MKKQISKKLVLLLLLSFTSVALISCVTATPESDKLTSTSGSKLVYEEGVPGGVATNVAKLSAKVSAIDYTTRRVTLVDDAGNKKSMVIVPEAVNFDQIRIGDLVKVAIAEETVVFLRDKGALAKDGAAGLVARAP